MAANSKIEWTTHTFNPWRGCTKISPGCAHCYAETLSHRNPKTLGIWGDNGTRVIASEAMWRDPLKWDRLAKEAGERHRVFCASLADVFENRPELDKPRHRLFHLINQTKNLDWLLLTKRPENIAKCCGGKDGNAYRSWTESPPPNIWLGVSVENQAAADERIPILLKTPATVRFLSVEPLLSEVILHKYFAQCKCGHGHGFTACPNYGGVAQTCHKCDCANLSPMIDWVIVGGESGSNARPMHPDWVRSIRDQCGDAGVAFFFKQWGGANKKAAGRIVDGIEWNEMPRAERGGIEQ